MKKTGILVWERTDEEKKRRHIYGDNGAKFKSGRCPSIDFRGVCGTVTTLVTKDILLIEYENEEDIRSISGSGQEG